MSEATEPEITTGAWILGQQAKLRAAEADANQLSKALEGITDPDPCTVFDHHGYCQTHGWLSETLCGHAAARIALRQHKEPDAGD